jgi:hypothetical protein
MSHGLVRPLAQEALTLALSHRKRELDPDELCKITSHE